MSTNLREKEMIATTAFRRWKSSHFTIKQSLRSQIRSKQQIVFDFSKSQAFRNYEISSPTIEEIFFNIAETLPEAHGSGTEENGFAPKAAWFARRYRRLSGHKAFEEQAQNQMP